MLLIAEEAGAQQGNQGNNQPTGGSETAITQPVVKYRPPAAPKYGPPPRVITPRPPVVVKYGPPSSFKPAPQGGQTPN